MKSNSYGIQRFDLERAKQIDKYKYTSEFQAMHPQYYKDGQILEVVRSLLNTRSKIYKPVVPEGWNEQWVLKMHQESEEERIVISGALLAAELDMNHFIEHNCDSEGEVLYHGDQVSIHEGRFDYDGRVHWKDFTLHIPGVAGPDLTLSDAKKSRMIYKVKTVDGTL